MKGEDAVDESYVNNATTSGLCVMYRCRTQGGAGPRNGQHAVPNTGLPTKCIDVLGLPVAGLYGGRHMAGHDKTATRLAFR